MAVARPRGPRHSIAELWPALDPFELHAQGDDVLLRELDALDLRRLGDVAVAFGLMDAADCESASREEITEAILAGVGTRRTP